LFIPHGQGQAFAQPQPCGNEAFQIDFPQASARLSKHNLGKAFPCVNLFPAISPQALPKQRISAENKGDSAFAVFLKRWAQVLTHLLWRNFYR
jgi:hypothetical protein